MNDVDQASNSAGSVSFLVPPEHVHLITSSRLLLASTECNININEEAGDDYSTIIVSGPDDAQLATECRIILQTLFDSQGDIEKIDQNL